MHSGKNISAREAFGVRPCRRLFSRAERTPRSGDRTRDIWRLCRRRCGKAPPFREKPPDTPRLRLGLPPKRECAEGARIPGLSEAELLSRLGRRSSLFRSAQFHDPQAGVNIVKEDQSVVWLSPPCEREVGPESLRIAGPYPPDLSALTV